MGSDHHSSEKFRQKRKPKGPIKFRISLNEEQKEAKSEMLKNDVTVLRGMAGSGKSLLASQVALDLLFTRQVDKIIITRPTVSKEDIGFLPGGIDEKMGPWLAPIYNNLYTLYDRDKIDKELSEGRIEIIPFAFLRGITFCNCAVIVDEAQNVTHSQMELVLGRMGLGSKMFITGDEAQIDLKDKRHSGFSFLKRLEENVEGFKTFTLQQNHRHKIVSPILEIYKLYRD